MLHSAVDIVAITTGRETLLIGPSSAFGAAARRQLIRDHIRLRHALDMFMTRPGASDLVRPHLRRWGLHWAHSRLSEKETVKDALLRAAASGQLAIAVIPEVTMAFSKVHAAANDPMNQARLARRPTGGTLPAAIEDRLTLVIEMVPGYMTGATRQAFENALADTGIGMVTGGLMTWLGAHFIPGVNVAVLAFDLFFLGSDVIRACEAIGEAMGDIGNARSRDDLEPAAEVIAGAIAVLLAAGILKRLLKAKQVTHGPGKEGGSHIVQKPGSGPKEARAVREPRRPPPPVTEQVHAEDATSAAPKARPAAAPAAGKKKKEIWTKGRQPSGARNALEHWKKHGSDFPDVKNSKQYVEKAKDFLDNPPAGTLSKTRTNGDIVRFDPATQTFGVMTKDGAPKTLYKPDPATHGYPTNLDYFNAQ